jgi:RNA polymerase sigma factor (sigma-70 family)
MSALVLKHENSSDESNNTDEVVHHLLLEIGKSNDVQIRKQAFTDLHRMFNERLERHLSKYGDIDVHQLSDLSQMTWMRVYNNAHKYRGVHGARSAKSFILTIADNIARNAIREAKRRRTQEITIDSDLLAAILADDGRTPEEHYIAKELHEQKLKDLTQYLTSHEMEVLRLLIRGYLQKEVAKKVGSSPSAVSQTKKRILDKHEKQRQHLGK